MHVACNFNCLFENEGAEGRLQCKCGISETVQDWSRYYYKPLIGNDMRQFRWPGVTFKVIYLYC